MAPLACRDDICSPQFWILVWEENVAGMPGSGSGGYTSSRIWDRMAADYDRWGEKEAKQIEEDENRVAMLSERGLFREGMRVLDVGCGTGRMAIAFARHGAKVCALDFSPAMLGRVREALPANLAPRIELVQADWEEVDLARRKWEDAFDLVYARMTPAVRTAPAFLNLQSASRAGCYYQGWAGRRRDPLLEDLRRHLTGKPGPALAGKAGGVFVAFNLLYAMGCSPSVEFHEVSWERSEPVEKAVDFYTEYFDGLANPGGQNLGGKISEYLTSVAENGHVTRRTQGRTGTITWRTLRK